MLHLLELYVVVQEILETQLRAQRAVVFGPFKWDELVAMATELGNAERAQVAAVKHFMQERLGMSLDNVGRAGGVQACWTDNNGLLVKFRSVAQGHQPIQKEPPC